MPREQQGPPAGSASFLAAQAALSAIEEALPAAHPPQAAPQPGGAASPEQALTALLLLRHLREQLNGWETGLIETARRSGASWADLAPPLGVASRQAAERRYLRLRPGAPGATGEQRVQATRDHRAAERAVTAWARDNAAHLRQLAGQLAALAELPPESRAALTRALGDDNAAALLAPLTSARPHLAAQHPQLATRLDDLARHTDQLRRASTSQRRPAN